MRKKKKKTIHNLESCKHHHSLLKIWTILQQQKIVKLQASFLFFLYGNVNRATCPNYKLQIFRARPVFRSDISNQVVLLFLCTKKSHKWNFGNRWTRTRGLPFILCIEVYNSKLCLKFNFRRNIIIILYFSVADFCGVIKCFRNSTKSELGPISVFSLG
jgi:hypothetical protein